MIWDIFQGLVLFVIASFPIVIWGYVFSYIDDNPLNKKRFFVGILWWAIAVLPILYLDPFISLFGFEYLNIFRFIAAVKNPVSAFEFSLSLAGVLLCIIGASFILWAWVKKNKQLWIIYMKNTVVFLWISLLIAIFTYLIHIFFTPFDREFLSGLEFGDILFNSFKLVIFYYILVSFIEETSKHFNFLQSSVLYIDSIKTGVLYSIFVALGFALIENLLYLYQLYQHTGLSWELLKVYFFRSVFSVIVHVLCSSVVAYYFSKALLMYRWKDLSFAYVKMFLVWIFISILLHLIFDVALTLWFGFIMFIYFIWGYLYVSHLFYSEG